MCITICGWTFRKQVCNMFFHFLKSQTEKYTAMFYLIIGVFTVTQVEACSIISLDHKRIISRERWNEVPTGPWHIVIHFFTEVCLIRVRQDVVRGGIVKKQNIVQIGVWFGCGIPDLQCQTSVAYKNTEKNPKLVAEIYITQWPFKRSHVNIEIWKFFPTGLFNFFFFLPEKVVGTGDGCAEVVQMISVDVSDSTLHFLPEIVLTKGITMNKNMCLKFILKHY